jgi:hypothetical protein
MEKDLMEIKHKLDEFVNKYNIADFDIYVSENLMGIKTVTLRIEV